MEAIHLCLIFLLKWGVAFTTITTTDQVSDNYTSTTSDFRSTQPWSSTFLISKSTTNVLTVNTTTDTTTQPVMSYTGPTVTSPLSGTPDLTENSTTMTTSTNDTTTNDSSMSFQLNTTLGQVVKGDGSSPEQIGIIIGSVSGVLVVLIVIIVLCIRLRSKPKSLLEKRQPVESWPYTGDTCLSIDKGEKHGETQSDGNQNYCDDDKEISLMDRKGSNKNITIESDDKERKPRVVNDDAKSLSQNGNMKAVSNKIPVFSNYQEIDEEMFLKNRQNSMKSGKSTEEKQAVESMPEVENTKHELKPLSSNYQEIDEEMFMKNRKLSEKSVKSNKEETETRLMIENKDTKTVPDSTLTEHAKNNQSIELVQTEADELNMQKGTAEQAAEPIYAQSMKKTSKRKHPVSMNTEAMKNILEECEKYLEDCCTDIRTDDVYTNEFSSIGAEELDNIYEDAESVDGENIDNKNETTPKKKKTEEMAVADDHYDMTDFDNSEMGGLFNHSGLLHVLKPEDDDDIYDNKEVDNLESIKGKVDEDYTYDCAMSSLTHDKPSDIYDSTLESDYDLTEHENGKRRFIIVSKDENYDHCILPEEREDYDFVELQEDKK